MTFTELLALVTANPGIRICCDSRRVGAGSIFVAITGTNFDGYAFIPQAVQNGAACIVSQRLCECKDTEVILVQDSAVAFALLAQAALGNPSAKLANLAVTGTNGKTTVSYLVRAVIETARQKCGLIGTIVYHTSKDSKAAALTTPDAGDIAQMARQTLDAGAKYMVIEASSHALSQGRLAGINFTAAAFTNLTGDHLDYHGTLDDYLAAKMKLFEMLPSHAVAILNKQSPASEKIAAGINVRKLWYAVDAAADITAQVESASLDATCFRLCFNGQTQHVKTALIGGHNVSNHLAAAGLCLAAGFDLPTIAKGLSALEFVPGRLEPVRCGQSFHVFIDYAHTDDAIKNVLTTLRPLAKANLTIVFGCGGDRDKTKRARMANVAEQLADRIFVTSDNPRTEPAEKIIADIVAGFTGPDSEKITIQPDRKKAIELAIKSAKKDDIILIAGKGHETYQIIGSERFDFDDKVIARGFLATEGTEKSF